ncbi:MAG: hypothetical protein ACKVS9_11375 [Phycisphaerae bacterium]
MTRLLCRSGFTSVAFVVVAAGSVEGVTRNILITGFWPPTNEMLRPWSTNAAQNPTGWIGEDWEGRGYNVHSYFPEFPGGVTVNPRGVGDFEVDYQDTSNDWWRITDELDPVAIITFSRGHDDRSWELESRNIKWERQGWFPDYLLPLRPTADLPIFDEPDNTIRDSSLPMNAIRGAVNAAGLGVNSYIDTGDEFGGNFVSNFIGYHGLWYHDLHSDPSDPRWNIAAGHIHVGIQTSTEQGRAATELTLRELTTYLDTVIPEPGSLALLLFAGVALPRRR